MNWFDRLVGRDEEVISIKAEAKKLEREEFLKEKVIVETQRAKERGIARANKKPLSLKELVNKIPSPNPNKPSGWKLPNKEEVDKLLQ